MRKMITSGRSNKTFKPKKNINEGSHQHDLMKYATATLGSGNLRLAVRLPDGEDLNEWVAVNIVDFFNQINMLYGTITEYCSENTCPVMSAGPKYEYHWADGHTVKKPIKCSAPKYIDYLMTWVQDQLDDELLFPSKIGIAFPSNFMQCAKTILKRLFRVYAHIYHEHFGQVVQLKEEAHLNTSFKHFIFFVQEFNLIDKRELAPLQELIDSLIERDYQTYQSSNSSNNNNSELTKQEQLQQQLEQLQLQHNQLNSQLNNQINNQINNQTNQQVNNQIKCQINLPTSSTTKQQDFIESTSTINSFNSVITNSSNESSSNGLKKEQNQYSDNNSRVSSSGNSNKLENAYF